MKNNFLTSVLLLSAFCTTAQVAKKSVVEHFTNSNCGVCAGTNPTIYNALNANAGALHITFHPSSPYASCVFSQQNPVENDARTNFYGIYGGTPKVISNGMLVGAGALAANLTAAANAMSNFDIKIEQTFITVDSVSVNVVIKKVAADTLTNAILFVGAKQDTVNQTTGNGESIHRDVFRKALTSIGGNNILLPVNVNDSVMVKYNYKVAATWQAARMQCIGILQAGNKVVINAAQSVNVASQVPTGIANIIKINNAVYPNPASTEIHITNWQQYEIVEIISNVGTIVLSKKIISATTSVNNLATGIYTVFLKNAQQTVVQKLQIIK